MDFNELLIQVRDTLEREGRVAYRVLKRRFELDDDDIEDIKADLIDAKRIALDEDGKVMLWASGDAATDKPPTEIPAEADRRLLTVMFCDIVDSTALSEKFDAEELRDLIRQFQVICTEIIERFKGHVAQYLGDGLLVYFGYPVAQEDEAYQAVRSGIDILAGLKQADAITDRLGSPMRVRIGVHTGSVVIGEMGAPGRHERLALGDTPNIAARVQGIARPDEILISGSTHRLIEGLFDVEALGPQDLKGVSKALDLYRVVGEGTAESRFEVALSTGKLTRFVGQDEELALLNQHWTSAQNARGQVILLSAEPGMGKSRLAQEFKDRIADKEIRHMAFRCSPYHQASPLYPVIQVMQRVFRFDADDTPANKLAKIDATLDEYRFSDTDAVPLVSDMLSLSHPEFESLQKDDPHKRRRRLFQVLTEWFLEESRRAPVYMIWDDLHWADPSTLDLLELYLDHVPASATLALLIYRSNYTVPWKQRGFFRHLSLNRLNDIHVEELVADIAGEQTIPTALVEEIKDRTDGIPLYVEELTRTVVDSGLLDDTSLDGGDTSIGQILIPMTLQDSLEARLDRCPIGKEIAQWGATIGREFSYPVLRSVVGDGPRLNDGINELLEAEIIYRSGSPAEPSFIFKHALLRDTAYESLLIRKRRDYHGQIAKALEAEFPRIAETQPEVIARHYTEGELIDDAVRFWHRAGQYAMNRSADTEAMGHLQQGLDLVRGLARTRDRAQAELDLQMLLGTLVIGAKGNAVPEVEAIYRRALALCDEIDDSAAKAPAYFGLRSYYLAKADLAAEHEISVTLLAVAETDNDEGALLEAHVALTNSFLFLGDEEKVYEHATAAAEIYDVERHRGHASIYGLDPGAVSHVRLAWTARMRGCTGETQAQIESSLGIVEEISHPITEAFVFCSLAVIYRWVRDHGRALHYANESLAVSSKYGSPFYLAWALVEQGYLVVVQGDAKRGLAQIEDGMAKIDSVRMHLMYPWFATLYAAALGMAGDPERGLAILPEAVAIIEKTGARYCEGDLYCVKGHLLRQAKLPSEAERAFEQTLAIAQRRGLHALELKGAIGIAELKSARVGTDAALLRLRTLYDRFAGEPESPDLRDARELLDP